MLLTWPGIILLFAATPPTACPAAAAAVFPIGYSAPLCWAADVPLTERERLAWRRRSLDNTVSVNMGWSKGGAVCRLHPLTTGPRVYIRAARPIADDV